MSRMAGVAGDPIAHSLSPVLHAAWLAGLGMEGGYVPLQIPLEGAADSLRVLAGSGMVGINVTAPLKTIAASIADSAEDFVLQTGAANLLLFDNGKIHARNTDGPALIACAQAAGWLGGPVIVIGAGGAARAAVMALLQAGALSVLVFNRTLERAEDLARIDSRIIPAALKNFAALSWDATLVVHTAGANCDCNLTSLPGDAIVLDMTYRPLDTPMLQAARLRGLVTVDGLDMLIAQARPSFQAFYGVAAPDMDIRAILDPLARAS